MFVNNQIRKNVDSVYELVDEYSFNYSDGSNSEKYLDAVFNKEKNLSSNSQELEDYMVDWPSEYHLSSNRSLLLSEFDFDNDSSVLEIGCGCGAITRFLGENFKVVHSVEGSKVRASLARKRTLDLENVQIVSAPFDLLNFKYKYDYIFCIGVLEYARSFVEGDDPYDLMIKKMKGLLKDTGVLVVAIENQFGLKYFNGAFEDHTAVKYDGIEGYHAFPNKARTFGYNELKTKIGEHFSNIDFYFPYPDYKLPNLLISEKITGKVNLSGLFRESIRKQNSRFRRRSSSNFIDELAFDEIDKNDIVKHFSNSFLIFCDNCDLDRGHATYNRSKWGAILYNYNSTKSKLKVLSLMTDKSQSFFSKKYYINSKDYKKVEIGLEPWIEGRTLEQVLNESLLCRIDPFKVFCEYLAKYYKFLEEKSYVNDDKYLNGTDIDLLFRNIILNDDKLVCIDKEHDFKSPVKTDIVFLRALYYYLIGLRGSQYVDKLSKTTLKIISNKNIKKLLVELSNKLNIIISNEIIEEFCVIESQFLYNSCGGDRSNYNSLVKKHLKLNLIESSFYLFAKNIVRRILRLFTKELRYRKMIGKGNNH